MFTIKIIEPNRETINKRFSRCVCEFSFYYCYRFVVCIKKPCISSGGS